MTATAVAAATIHERACKIICEHLGVEPPQVMDDAKFGDDLGADSLDLVELVMAFEAEFKIEVDDAEAETITTVGDAMTLLERKAQGAPK
jgi:acyl carrier protein